MVERGLSIQDLADRLGWSYHKVWAKLKGTAKINTDDISEFVTAMDLSRSDTFYIFFDPIVSKLGQEASKK